MTKAKQTGTQKQNQMTRMNPEVTKKYKAKWGKESERAELDI